MLEHLKKLWETIGNFSSSLIGLIMAVLVFAGPFLVYKVFPLQAYHISGALALIALAVALTFLLIAIVPKARSTAGAIICGASYPFLLFLWVWSVDIVGNEWGIGTLYFLNCFIGIGAILGAFIVSIFGGHWWMLTQLVIIVSITIALWVIGSAISESNNKLEHH
jgi:hypothetical protein